MLHRPRKLIVTVHSSPAVEIQPWHLHLYRLDRDAGYLNEMLTAVVEQDALWSREVVPGEYVLKIGRSDGSVWHSTELAVAATDVHRTISIPVERVMGSVRLGETPLPGARLIFGGESGSQKLSLVTDREGRFSGEIPAQEKRDANWKITIAADAPRVKRTAEYEPVRRDNGDLELDIVLPNTTVKGRVVDADRHPVDGALVTLRSTAAGVFEQTFADVEGRFELFGFEPGTYSVSAEAFQRASEIRTVQASDTGVHEVELVLQSVEVVRGRVQSRNAVGVEARLTALQREVKAATVPYARTDGNGRFELKLPPQTRSCDLIVQAPGFPLSIGRLVIQKNKLLTLTIDQIGGELALEIPNTASAVIAHEGSEIPALWLVGEFGGTVAARDGWDLATVRVETGNYALCANGRCKTGMVPPDGKLLLSLRDGN